jgi:hypothetical protein
MEARTALEIVLLIAGGLAVRALVLHWGQRFLRRPERDKRPARLLGASRTSAKRR